MCLTNWITSANVFTNVSLMANSASAMFKKYHGDMMNIFMGTSAVSRDSIRIDIHKYLISKRWSEYTFRYWYITYNGNSQDKSKTAREGRQWVEILRHGISDVKPVALWRFYWQIRKLNVIISTTINRSCAPSQGRMIEQVGSLHGKD